MGQKANPIGNRLGIIKGWDSNWFGGRNYSDKLVEDEKIRNYIKARLPKGSISINPLPRLLSTLRGRELSLVKAERKLTKSRKS
jgi:small subunit ribosomal protein S3